MTDEYKKGYEQGQLDLLEKREEDITEGGDNQGGNQGGGTTG